MPNYQMKDDPLRRLIESIERERYGDLRAPASGQIWAVDDVVSFPDGREETLEPDPIRPSLVLLMGFDEDFAEDPLSVASTFPISEHWNPSETVGDRLKN